MASIISGVRHTYHTSFAQGCFHSTNCDFVTSSMVHFRSPLYHASAFKKAFPCPFTTQPFTSPAAQGDLTTLPDIALPMGHYPSSVKELIMAQAEITEKSRVYDILFRSPFTRGVTSFQLQIGRLSLSLP